MYQYDDTKVVLTSTRCNFFKRNIKIEEALTLINASFEGYNMQYQSNAPPNEPLGILVLVPTTKWLNTNSSG
jgi:hypothetical protein